MINNCMIALSPSFTQKILRKLKMITLYFVFNTLQILHKQILG
jgi:hypothetical protein